MRRVFWLRQSLLLPFLFLDLLVSSDALQCYSTSGLVTPIAISVAPKTSVDCNQVLDTWEPSGASEVEAKLLRSDEENFRNLPVCFVNCQGATQQKATCTYSCTRNQACVNMQQISKQLQSNANVEALTATDCKTNPANCRPKWYYHSCCFNSDNCNSSDASSLLASYVLKVSVIVSSMAAIAVMIVA